MSALPRGGKGIRLMKCIRESCNNSIPPDKRKYCSDECRKTVNQQRSYEQRRRVGIGLVSKRLRKQKLRTCLGCNKEFMSSGPWNRLCPSCAQKNNSHKMRTYSVPHRGANSGEDHVDGC